MSSDACLKRSREVVSRSVLNVNLNWPIKNRRCTPGLPFGSVLAKEVRRCLSFAFVVKALARSLRGRWLAGTSTGILKMRWGTFCIFIVTMHLPAFGFCR
jgi:hypothetical protein